MRITARSNKRGKWFVHCRPESTAELEECYRRCKAKQKRRAEGEYSECPALLLCFGLIGLLFGIVIVLATYSGLEQWLSGGLT